VGSLSRRGHPHDPVWQLFIIGYFGYTGGRSWEKVKDASK
jgi:hypothetical protein